MLWSLTSFQRPLWMMNRKLLIVQATLSISHGSLCWHCVSRCASGVIHAWFDRRSRIRTVRGTQGLVIWSASRVSNRMQNFVTGSQNLDATQRSLSYELHYNNIIGTINNSLTIYLASIHMQWRCSRYHLYACYTHGCKCFNHNAPQLVYQYTIGEYLWIWHQHSSYEIIPITAVCAMPTICAFHVSKILASTCTSCVSKKIKRTLRSIFINATKNNASS